MIDSVNNENRCKRVLRAISQVCHSVFSRGSPSIDKENIINIISIRPLLKRLVLVRNV